MRKIILSAFLILMFTTPAFPAEEKEAHYPSYKDPITGMEFVYVKGGCFKMGDMFGDGYSDEMPVHEVCVGDFYIGRHEVTQRQWKDITGKNPSYFKACGDNCPVENVSWNDVREYIRRLNQRTKDNPRPPVNKGEYRLPTEAEWEYSARSRGRKEKYAGASTEAGLGDYAWYDKNSGGKTHPVGGKKPNGIGIYDMSGNVWEWVSDQYAEDYYKSSLRNNPAGPVSGRPRVLRGGSWISYAWNARLSNRHKINPDIRSFNYGFRLAMTP